MKAAGADGSAGEGPDRGRILVAEDDEESRTALRMLLEAYGYRVLAAADGAEAVAKAREHHPDLILMDLMMPVMGGLEAARRIRGQAGLDDITIICVSATRDAAVLTRRAEGIDSFVPKPIDPQVLRRNLDRWLDRDPPRFLPKSGGN